jgi:type IX secretion system PorP/SprF family membrane protein
MPTMKIFNIALVAACIATVNGTFAQQLPLSSQYHQNMLTINPAYSGFNELTTITASHRTMLTGLPGSPQTSYVSVQGQGADGRMGLAFVAFQDRTDILSLTSGMVNYVYKAKLGEGSSLNFGLGVGIQNFGIDFDKAKVNDETDPILFDGQRQNRIGFNSEFGTVLQVKGFELGFAIPQLLANKRTFTDITGGSFNYNSIRHIRGSVKYDFILNEKRTVKFYPLAVVRYVNGAPFQWDASGILDVKNACWIGVTYHSTFAVSVSAGLRLKGFSLGYAHDFSMGAVNDFSKRSSEFILSYQIGNKEKDNKRIEEIEKEIEDLKALKTENQEQTETIEELQTKQEELEGQIRNLEEKLVQETKALEEALKNVGNNSGNAGNTGNNSGNTGSTGNNSNGSANTNKGNSEYRLAKASDFYDEKDKRPEKGYYVVIGSFEVKANAEKWKKKNKSQGKTSILYDSALRMHQVVVYYSSSEAEAMAERLKKSKKQKAWVLKLE